MSDHVGRLAFRLQRSAMWTEFEFLLEGEDELALRVAAEEAWEEVERLEGMLSRFDPHSDLSYLNRRAHEEAVRVTPELWQVLAIAVRIHRGTGGAFDPTVAPLVACWGIYRREGRVPSEGERMQALRRVGLDAVEFDPDRRSVRFRREGMELDLGGIAKGYALERAQSRLAGAGVQAGILHAGHSSVTAWGGHAWPVGLERPYRSGERLGVVALQDKALSTSSGSEQAYTIGGETFSHLIDPRTGWPAKGMAGVTVVGPGAAAADALSTAFFVMGRAETMAFLERHTEWGAVLLAEADGEPEAIGVEGLTGPRP